MQEQWIGKMAKTETAIVNLSLLLYLQFSGTGLNFKNQHSLLSQLRFDKSYPKRTARVYSIPPIIIFAFQFFLSETNLSNNHYVLSINQGTFLDNAWKPSTFDRSLQFMSPFFIWIITWYRVLERTESQAQVFSGLFD